VVIVNVVLGCSTTSEVSSGPDSILLLQRKPTGLLAAQWEFVVQDLGPVASTTVPRLVVLVLSTRLGAPQRHHARALVATFVCAAVLLAAKSC